MKKILILGGARSQLNLIRKAKGMGLFTIVVGTPGNYPGYKLADKYYPIDIYDKEGVLNICYRECINGIALACSDFGITTLGYVCDNLHLNGVSEESALLASNKFRMKEAFINNGVRTAKYVIVRNESDAKECSSKLSFPIIVKAVDLQGSRGIFIAHNKYEVVEYSSKAIEESRESYCIAEEYLSGEECGAQAFIHNGAILFIVIHGDIVYNAGTNKIPIGHYVPKYDKSSSIYNDIISQCTKAIHALGIDNCAVNIDLIISDNLPYVIEIAARAGANYLPELISAYFGIDYYKMILMNALNCDIESYFASNKKISDYTILSRMLYSDSSGTIDKISAPNDVELFVGIGDRVNRFESSKDCIGQTLCKGSSLEDCEIKMQHIISNIDLSLI